MGTCLHITRLRSTNFRCLLLSGICLVLIGTAFLINTLSFEDNQTQTFDSKVIVKETNIMSDDDMASTNKKGGLQNSKIQKSDHHCNKKFDLQVVHDEFRDALNADGSVNLDAYLRAYNELLRFVHLLGRLFTFVGSDVVEKIGILEGHRKSDAGANYDTVGNMIAYEVKNKITIVKGHHPPSGARTLLRLHRALLFLSEFMRRLADMGPHDKIGTATYQAYEDTLAHYHTWFVRKAFGVAVYAVPSRQHLLDEMCHTDNINDEAMLELLKSVPRVMKPIYDATQTMYEDNNLLDLP